MLLQRFMAGGEQGLRSKSKKRHFIEILESRLLLSKTIYVDASASDPTHDGTSWTNAFIDLQQGLAAAVAGDEIHIADGTYKPTSGTDRTISFALKPGVSLFGGYAGYGAPDPESRDVPAYASVLSGDIGVGRDIADNSYHVVTATQIAVTTEMNGLTVTLGNANESETDCDGGGLFTTLASSLTINNCTFRENAASSHGGGLYNYDSWPVLNDCKFIQNTANFVGGGMCNASYSSPVLNTCSFSENTATYEGGGIYNEGDWTRLADCSFTRNATGGFGAGMCNSAANANLDNCAFSGNSAGVSGGAMCNGSSPTFVKNCTFRGNTSAKYGGAVYESSTSSKFSNCIFSGNRAGMDGGGMYDSSSAPIVTDCTFSGNTALDDGGAIYNVSSSPIITNCIVWGSGSSPIYNIASTPNITYSDIQGGYRGVGNINVDPQFVRLSWSGPDGVFGTADDDNGDLRLRSSSACLDAGLNAATPGDVTSDLAGNPRIQNGTVDLGAYEGAFAAPASRVIYVDLSSAGANTGASWADAYTSLQAGILSARDGDIIRIADGIYNPTSGVDRTISFALRSGVSLLGGYAGYAASNPDTRNIVAHPTILSGDIGTVGNNSDNSYHVVTALGIGLGTVVDGLTVTLGNANGDAGQASGAGIYAIDCLSLTVANCSLNDNGASYAGGGMYNSSGSPSLTNCTFFRNSSFDGGGMYNHSISSPTLNNCTFIANGTDSHGGGMYNDNFSSPNVFNCIFNCNSSGADGGGIFNLGASPVLANCTFTGNSAALEGGGVYSNNPPATLFNCIVYGNAARSGAQIYSSWTDAVVTYSNIQGGWTGAGNIDVDPLFVRNPSAGADGAWGTADDDYGDLRLQPCSPVADAGNNGAVPAGAMTDHAGNNRFTDVPTTADTGVGVSPIVDMGAYEAVPALSAHAGSPYRVTQGLNVTLTGYGASDAPGALRFDWAWDGDGLFDDATGPTPSFSATATPGMRAVALRVTDALGRSVQSGTTLEVAPAIVYVDAEARGACDGRNWSDAYTSLAAILKEAIAGQAIRVADGVYKPTTGIDRSATFQLKNGVSIYGGYAGSSDPGAARNISAYPTILSGEIGIVGDSSDNSFVVVTGSGTGSSAVLDGFTITAGHGHIGGGMYNSSGSPTIANCTFVSNFASFWGAGMCNVYSSPIVINCTFSANFSGYDGGGMCNSNYSSPTLRNCVFTGNSARYDGGGIYDDNASSPSLENCSFSGNSATYSGAGMYNGNSSPTVTNCAFIGNSVIDDGGGMYNSHYSSPVLTNCTFVGNSAGWRGGGLYDQFYSSATLINCIVSANTAPNGSQMLNESESGAIVRYCNIQGGYVGTGNINADPLFVRNPSGGIDGKWGTADDDYGDLRLRVGSPCLDAGDNAAVPTGVTTDLAGNSRVVDMPNVRDYGDRVDMGAYEYQPPLAYLFNATGPSVRMSFGFDVDVATLSATDLVLLNVSSGQPVSTSSATVSYDAGTLTATWQFTGVLPDGDYRATLPAGSVNATSGAPLSSDALCNFFSLGGDANRDRKVDINDLYILATNWQGGSKLFSQGDFNYDGKVDPADLAILSAHWQQLLAPPVAAPTAIRKPTVRSPVRMVSVVE